MTRRRIPIITGDATLDSPWFSNHWELRQGEHLVADIRRIARTYVSTADLGKLGRLVLEPTGRGTVHAIDEFGAEVGRITRRSWMGRHWEIAGNEFNYDLYSDHRPRRWHFSIANAPMAQVSGSMLSYNHVTVHSALAIPVPAVLLAWHVIARPWEAANEPRHLLPGVTDLDDAAQPGMR